MRRLMILICLGWLAALSAGPKHSRDGSYLPKREQQFAEQLSIHKRRIFCGQFNIAQRQTAMKYARGLGKDACYTPDEAVVKVMEETGMSLAERGRPKTTE